MLWQLLTLGFALLTLAMALTLVVCFHRFSFLQRLAKKHRFLSWLCAIALPAALIAPFLAINIYTALVVVLHLFVIWILCDLVALAVRKLSKQARRRYYAGAAALLLTALYLGYGWYQAHHVYVTRYTLGTQKALSGPVRIVELADSHLGITLDGDSFSAQVDRIAAEHPDLVVITGDFVGDDTLAVDMHAACRALGRLHPTYGICFVFGNHDKGYYQYRDFDSAELRQALAEAGITVLEDESLPLDCGITVVGRQDRSTPGRMSAAQVLEGTDPADYRLMLDHQPNDYAAEAAAGPDLVLSGHTHGGHIWPAGLIGLATGANDRTYGMEQRGDTVFLVTSGISGWAIPFKTGTFSEFVVIDLIPEG